MELIPFLLTGKNKDLSNQQLKPQELKELILEPRLPFECTIDFDFEVVDIFKRLLTEKIKAKDRIIALYTDCKKLLSKIPSRLEFFWKLAVKNPIQFLCKTHKDIFSFDGTKMNIILDLSAYIKDEFFLQQVVDAINFRRTEFIDIRL